MRFTAATVVFAAGAMAGSTIYSTDYVTVTSCGPTVTNCPASSTSVSSKVYEVTPSVVYTTTVKTITSCAPEVTNCPGKGKVITETIPISTTLCPVSTTHYGNGTFVPVPPTKVPGTGVPVPTGTTGKPPGGDKPAVPVTLVTSEAACPTISVKTISTSITTVIPTVIYETVSVACPTGKPTGTGSLVPSANATVPVTKPTTPVTAGAASLGGSVLLAAAAGLAAVVLA